MRRTLVCVSLFVLTAATSWVEIPKTSTIDAAKSVAQVFYQETKEEPIRNIGSAFLFSANKLLTAWHVVSRDGIYRVTFPSGETFLVKTKKQLGTDDAATIEVEGTPKALPLLLRNALPNVLEDVFAIGYPENYGQLITQGVVSGLQKTHEFWLGGDESETYISLVYFTAGIGPGNSGGAVIDSSGRVIALIVIKSGSVNDLQVGISSLRLVELLNPKK